MDWIPQIFRRRKFYEDLSEEIRLHIEERTEQLMHEGMSAEEATWAARRAFGNWTLIEERSREVWQWPTLESIVADLRFCRASVAPFSRICGCRHFNVGSGHRCQRSRLWRIECAHPAPAECARGEEPFRHSTWKRCRAPLLSGLS